MRPGESAPDALWRGACGLARAYRLRHPDARRLPPLLFFTDPDRTPDPVGTAERLPSGTGVVFRHFGRPGADAIAGRLAIVARRRGLVLLIGEDDGLAASVGAAGIHLPERRLWMASRIRRRRPDWIITAAVHSAAALARAARSGADAAVLSPVFPSRSPSAGRPLGLTRSAILTRQTDLPIYALGGVDGVTVRALVGTGAAGVAAVGGVVRPD